MYETNSIVLTCGKSKDWKIREIWKKIVTRRKMYYADIWYRRSSIISNVIVLRKGIWKLVKFEKNNNNKTYNLSCWHDTGDCLFPGLLCNILTTSCLPHASLYHTEQNMCTNMYNYIFHTYGEKFSYILNNCSLVWSVEDVHISGMSIGGHNVQC